MSKAFTWDDDGEVRYSEAQPLSKPYHDMTPYEKTVSAYQDLYCEYQSKRWKLTPSREYHYLRELSDMQIWLEANRPT